MKGLFLLTVIGIAFAAPSDRLSSTCNVCVLFVDEVRELLTVQHTQDAVLDYVAVACSHLEGEDKDVCRLLVDQYSGNLLQNAANHLTSREFCNQLPGVCSSDEEEQPTVIERPPVEEVEDSQPEGPLECELCKLLVLGVDKLIKTNKSDAAINATLEKLCDSLPAKIAPLCKEIEPKILDAIKNGVDPDTACKVAALCAIRSDYAVHHVTCDVCVEAMDAIGIQDPHGICLEFGSCIQHVAVELPEPVSNTVIQPEETEVEDTIECQICKFAVQAIDKLVGENKTVATINQTLYELCNQLPGELKDSCLNVEPEVLKAILGGVDPSKACDFVKACQDSASVKLSDMYVPCGACIEVMDTLAGENGAELCFDMYDDCKGHEKPTAVELKPAEIGDDARCELCKFVITLLDEVAATNSSISYVNATLFEICKALPQELQQICASLVPQIDKIMATGIDPNNTCIAVDFCTATQEPVPFLSCESCNTLTESVLPTNKVDQVGRALCAVSCHHRNRRSIADMMEYWTSEASSIQQYITDEHNLDANFIGCEVCKIAIRLVDEIAGQNATLQTVNQTLQEICNRLSGEQLVQICLQEMPKIVALMANGVEPGKVCTMAKLCDAAKVELADPVPEITETSEVEIMDEPNDLKCDLCKELIQFVDSRLQDNATDEMINKTLYQVCSGLPSQSLQEMCMAQIPPIMKVVEDGGFDPEKACEAAQLCAEDMGEKKTNFLKDTILPALRALDEPNDLKCDLCKEVVQFVDSRLQDNATDEMINETLYKVCTGLPSVALQDICMAQIPPIMKVVEAGGFDPDKACEAAKICAEAYKKHMQKDDAEKGNLKDLKCEICKAVIDEIDSVLGDNATIAQINETIFNLCNSLQGSLQDICLQLAPQVVEAVAGGVDYKLACGAIGLCPKAQDMDKMKATVLRTEEVGNLKDLKCTICKAVIDELDAVLGENSTVAKVNETVYNLCNGLQGALQDICNQLAPEVVSTIAGGVDYKLACGIIGLCPKAEQVSVVEDEPVEEEAKPLLCDACARSMHMIYSDLETDYPKIQPELKELCSNLPTDYQVMCEVFVTEDNGSYLKMFLQKFNPEILCENAGCQ